MEKRQEDGECNTPEVKRASASCARLVWMRAWAGLTACNLDKSRLDELPTHASNMPTLISALIIPSLGLVRRQSWPLADRAVLTPGLPVKLFQRRAVKCGRHRRSHFKTPRKDFSPYSPAIFSLRIMNRSSISMQCHFRLSSARAASKGDPSSLRWRYGDFATVCSKSTPLQGHVSGRLGEDRKGGWLAAVWITRSQALASLGT